MNHITEVPRRRSVRLKGYDYGAPGAYFVTICVQGRRCLFGNVVNGEMTLNALGEIVETEWLKTAEIRPDVELGAHAVMPNHLHGILILHDRMGAAPRGTGTARRAPTVEQFGKPVAGSIPTIVRAFKAAVTKRINEVRGTNGMAVWQRNYYEHIIRNEVDYNHVAEYVANNPKKWADDSMHPDNIHNDLGVSASKTRYCPMKRTARNSCTTSLKVQNNICLATLA